MSENLKHRSLRSVFWALSGGTGAALISLLAFLGMARLLEPGDFGIAAMAGAVVLLLNLIVGHGFPEAVIQLRAVRARHIDTAFWSTLGLAVFFALAASASAGAVAEAMGEPAVARVMHWLALILPLNALGIVHGAMLRRDLHFRKFTVTALVGRVAGAIVGLTMAAFGAGVWSLVGQQLAGAAAASAALLKAYPWRPRLRFSGRCFHSMAGFSVNVSASQLIAGISEQAVNLLVGSLLGSVVLGYFNVAWRTVHLLRSLIASALYQVGFSAFSRLRENSRALSSGFLRATQLSCLIGFPMGVGLALVSDHLITALYGAKWGLSVPILAWLAILFVPAFFAMFFTACYRAKGRADWVVYLMLADFVLTVAGIFVLRHEPVVWIAVMWVAKAAAFLPVHLILLRRLLGIGAGRLLKPTYIPMAACLLMAAAVFPADRWLFAGLGTTVVLVLDVAVGISVYWLAIRLLNPDLQRFALTTLKAMVPGR